jgi:hypothetical protein
MAAAAISTINTISRAYSSRSCPSSSFHSLIKAFFIAKPFLLHLLEFDFYNAMLEFAGTWTLAAGVEFQQPGDPMSV